MPSYDRPQGHYMLPGFHAFFPKAGIEKGHFRPHSPTAIPQLCLYVGVFAKLEKVEVLNGFIC
jgi:hypothetical protein